MAKNTGAFLIARQIYDSEIWLFKPATWLKIWIYILGRVNHADSKHFKRGEGYFQFSTEKDNIGMDITANMIKKCLIFLREKSMISTTRSTRGTRLRVLNYNKLQDMDYFRGTTQRTTEERQKNDRRTPIVNNVNNVNNDNKRAYMQKWLDYRKSIKKAITVKATFDSLVKRFNSEPIDKIEWVVNQSIENGYQGLFWDKYSNLLQSKSRGSRRQQVTLSEEEKEQYR